MLLAFWGSHGGEAWDLFLKLSLKIYFYFTYIGIFACMYVCVRVLGPLELELQTIVSCRVELGSFGRSASALNH